MKPHTLTLFEALLRHAKGILSAVDHFVEQERTHLTGTLPDRALSGQHPHDASRIASGASRGTVRS